MKKTKTSAQNKNFVRGRAQNKTCSLVTKKMTIAETMKKYPRSAFVFIDYGLHCVSCPMAGPETIEEAAKLHSLDLKFFLKDLNKAAKK